ncbi:hypothetical protein DL93DRAFT_2214946 [Clavulina sp. PMI_390]|nr:hypothetical protein DL93DRAFT_2214946 [Clavulina sp. PMI_390]
MAVAARQNNKGRKDGNPSVGGGGGPNRRGAWRGGPPNFVQSHHANRNNAGGGNGQHYNSHPNQGPLHGIENAMGSYVIVTTRNGARHSGFVDSIDADGSGFSLRNYRDLSAPNIPEKESMRFPAVQLLNWTRTDPPLAPNGTNASSPSGPSKGFRTDTDISQNGKPIRERELQAWSDSAPPAGGSGQGPTPSGRGDDITFGGGAGTGTGGWDQFSANQQLFGVTTNYDEELYTTKLDRSRPDYKERERQANQIANEINSQSSSNPHIAEERGVIDDSGVNEEDKYSTVVRGAGAYVPPGARAKLSTSQSQSPASTTPVAVSVTPPVAAPTEPAKKPTNGATSAAPTTAGGAAPKDLVDNFRDFVTSEKNRLVQKKQQIVKKEKDNRLADLLKFSQEFKLNRPIPEDLVPILAKDESKQKELMEKSAREAQSSKARAIGSNASTVTMKAAGLTPTITSATATPATNKAALGASSSSSNALASVGITNTTTMTRPQGPVAAASPAAAKLAVKAAAAASGAPTAPATGAPWKKLSIQAIPPFKGKRSSTTDSTTTVTSSGPVVSGSPGAKNGGATNGTASATSTGGGLTTPAEEVPNSPTSSTTSSAFKLNVKATSFKPNPNASAFKPGTSSPSGTPPTSTPSSSAPVRQEPKPVADHPFFGKVVIKMTPAVHIKDEFNIFRNKVPEAPTIAPTWPYNGKKYITLFPPPTTVNTNNGPSNMPQNMPMPHQLPNQPPHIPPPGQQPPPQQQQPGGPPQPPTPQGAPPPYDEDPAARSQQQQQQQQQPPQPQPPYQMMYYPYPYPGAVPGQPMMHMPAGAPPGAYMSPFVQHVQFPHQGAPHPFMSPPPMGPNGLPPQGYMSPPPPGAYPPNVNGGAPPRGSMPPTPMQQHAYAFHQSPQLPHAVPYMMMPPQPPVPQGGPGAHPFEGGGPPPGPQGPGGPGPMVGH